MNHCGLASEAGRPTARSTVATYSAGVLTRPLRVAGDQNSGCRNTARTSSVIDSPLDTNAAASASTIDGAGFGVARKLHNLVAMKRAITGWREPWQISVSTSGPFQFLVSPKMVFAPLSWRSLRNT